MVGSDEGSDEDEETALSQELQPVRLEPEENTDFK